MSIAWNVAPPRFRYKRSIRLLCVKAGEEFKMVVLGPQVGLQTHWTGTKTVPCCDVHECQFHDCPQTWKGYLPVAVENWSIGGKAPGVFPWVLVTTEEIGEEVSSLTRGQGLWVSRPGRNSKGPLCARILGKVKEEGLMPTFDVRPYILRASGFSRL